MNDNSLNLNSQEKISKHLEKPTEKKKKIPIFLEFMEDKKLKLERLKECGNFLTFITNKEKTKHRLVGGTFCKNRFCPICSWIKARKNAYQLLELLTVVRKKENKEFIFMTLTAPNVEADQLKEEITDFNKSFKRLFETKDFKAFSKGFIRKLEITYNSEKNTYHPHFHIIVAVNKSYFTDRTYISREKLLGMWRKAKRDETITQVDMKKIKMNSIKEIMEIATYSTKQKDLYYNKEIFDVFYKSMKGRQLLTFNGIFKEYRKLQLDHKLEIEDTELNEMKEKASLELMYKWEIQEYKEKLERILTDDDPRSFYSFDVDVD